MLGPAYRFRDHQSSKSREMRRSWPYLQGNLSAIRNFARHVALFRAGSDRRKLGVGSPVQQIRNFLIGTREVFELTVRNCKDG
jgi:hypothetical protein